MKYVASLTLSISSSSLSESAVLSFFDLPLCVELDK